MADYLDKAGATYLAGKIKDLNDKKVDKESGKGLSTNDYTTDEKTKLGGIEAGAKKNVQSDWNATSGDAFIKNKPQIPFVDDAMSDVSTNAIQNKIVKAYIDAAIGGITEFDIQVVTQLPATGVKGTFYFVPNGGTGTDTYDEYVYANNKWEKIGNTKVDLSGYVKKTDLVAITNSEIDAMFA